MAAPGVGSAGRSPGRAERIRARAFVRRIRSAMSDERPHGPNESDERLIAVAVGNTRARAGLFRGKEMLGSVVHPSGETEAIAGAVGSWLEDADGPTPVVMATVNRAPAEALERSLAGAPGVLSGGVLRIGRDVPLRIRHSLTEAGERTIGQDRLLCAIGAYGVCGQACVVVDLGTALTVDFVDGEGVFHGGAIAPGIGMMLRALHERTDALPDIEYAVPTGEETFGRDTASAMRLGVTAMARGAVRWLAERYAFRYEAYPRIIATGGDAGVLEDDELVETFVPDLQLMGILAAWRADRADEGAEDGMA